MPIVREILSTILIVFLLLLIFRIVMDYVFMLARSFRPQGPFAIALELTYSVTDPPIKMLQRVIPPLRVGNVAIDLAFTLVFIVTLILISVVNHL